MARPLDLEKINALASILMKLNASYSKGARVSQVMDIIKADPEDYPMSASWVQKYIYSDECAAHGIVRSASQKQPFTFYYDPSRAAHYNAKQEIMSSTSVTEDLADILVDMKERLERIENNQSSTGTNAKLPKHAYYLVKWAGSIDEADALTLMELPKPDVSEEIIKQVIGALLRTGKAKIGGKRKSD